MEPDVYTLAKAGLDKEEIREILECGNRETQIRILRKIRYRMLDEIHKKQQDLDEIDYMIGKMKEGT